VKRGVMTDLGKLILGLGMLLVVIGGLLVLAGHLGVSPGRLPGDFAWRGRNSRIYLPLGTSVLISIVLTLLLWLAMHFRK
jgi:ribose/xylose/arabinose/galactoside ABC-type transport system permease subunit